MEIKENNRKRVCKYGSTCYQKNFEHRKKFKHPDDLDEESAPKKNANGEISVTTPDTSSGKTVKDENENVGEITSISILDTSNVEASETVEGILKSMPKDFFDFWDFCCTLNKSKPQDAFSDLGYHLVGVYDILSKKLPKEQKVSLYCHWRYYYDPPEFQTLIKQDGKDLYHIGYFRDEPSAFPNILASNSAAVGPKLTLMGDNIFAAMNIALTKRLKESKKLKDKFSKLLSSLQSFAKKSKYSLEAQTTKTKARQKKVVTKTFHGLGIVVPVENDVGYRSLPDSDATLKGILKKIVDAKDENERLEKEESLDEIITNVHFANDECDYGMGLELGIDLFCFGDPYLHSHILSLLPLAYTLVKRPKYGEIVKAHLANRRKGGDLNDLDI